MPASAAPGAGHWVPVTLPAWGLCLQVWQLPLAALLLVLLLRWRPAAVRRPWRWLLAVPAALVVLPTDQISALLTWARLPLVLVALVWCLVDARVPLAGAVLLVAYVLPEVVLELAEPGMTYAWTTASPGLPTGPLSLSPSLLLELALAVLLVVAGALRGARQTYISFPHE